MTSHIDPDQVLARLRYEIAGRLVLLTARRYLKALKVRRALKGGFRPDQPRVPAGQREGGRWTRIGDGGDRGNGGFDAEGFLQPAFLAPAEKALEAVLAFFVFLSTRNSGDTTAASPSMRANINLAM